MGRRVASLHSAPAGSRQRKDGSVAFGGSPRSYSSSSSSSKGLFLADLYQANEFYQRRISRDRSASRLLINHARGRGRLMSLLGAHRNRLAIGVKRMGRSGLVT